MFYCLAGTHGGGLSNMNQTRILIVDDDPIARQLYGECLRQLRLRCVPWFATLKEQQLPLEASVYDVVVTDLNIAMRRRLSVLADAKNRDPGIEVILITAVDRVDPLLGLSKRSSGLPGQTCIS